MQANYGIKSRYLGDFEVSYLSHIQGVVARYQLFLRTTAKRICGNIFGQMTYPQLKGIYMTLTIGQFRVNKIFKVGTASLF